MDDSTYLNAAGTSYPKPESVLRAVREQVVLSPREQAAHFELARSTVAGALDGDKDGLLFTGSCTQALQIALLSLDWAEGDVLVTSHLEHHGLVRPIEDLVRLHGVVHEKVAYRAGEPFDLMELERLLQRGKVRLLALSAASNVTGEVLPITKAARLAKRHGALVLVDAAQLFGFEALSVREWGVDLLTFAGHKYPLGILGVGGLWMRPGLSFACRSAVCEVRQEGAVTRVNRPGFCDVGSVNLVALHALDEGLRWREGAEREVAMQRSRVLAAECAEQLRAMPGITVFGHHGGPQTAVVSLCHEELPLTEAETFFECHGILVRAGTHCAPDALSALGAPHGCIRISFGPFNSSDDLHRLLRAFREIRS